MGETLQSTLSGESSPRQLPGEGESALCSSRSSRRERGAHVSGLTQMINNAM